MIRKLRRKFILILMSVVAFILLAVFLSVFLSTWNNTRNLSENMLRQALTLDQRPQGFQPPRGDGRPSAGPMAGARMPVLVADVTGGEITILTNHLYFMDDEEIKALIRSALDTAGSTGALYSGGFRWMKSGDGARIALADVSMEQEMLRSLVVNSLLIGAAALAVFFCISLFLSRWAVRPVELAWKRQQEFVADASHELKTPLTVILSNADMLSGGNSFTDEKKARRMEHIQAEALRMKNLVEDLLILAKADGSKEPKVHSRVDFSFIVTNAVLTFEPVIYDERKRFSYDIRDGLFVLGDAQRLQQLIGILLDNARKYCPPGGAMRVDAKETNRKNLLLTVFNEGEPIPQGELEQIFLRFYRADKSRSAHGGYGLGLSIAQGIAKEHGGKIWAQSGEGGNSFFISLPLR